MCRVYYSYVVCHQNGIQKESGTASVDVNTSSESDAKAAAEGLAIKAKCYEHGSYFSKFKIESVSKH